MTEEGSVVADGADPTLVTTHGAMQRDVGLVLNMSGGGLQRVVGVVPGHSWTITPLSARATRWYPWQQRIRRRLPRAWREALRRSDARCHKRLGAWAGRCDLPLNHAATLHEFDHWFWAASWHDKVLQPIPRAGTPEGGCPD